MKLFTAVVLVSVSCSASLDVEANHPHRHRTPHPDEHMMEEESHHHHHGHHGHAQHRRSHADHAHHAHHLGHRHALRRHVGHSSHRVSLRPAPAQEPCSGISCPESQKLKRNTGDIKGPSNQVNCCEPKTCSDVCGAVRITDKTFLVIKGQADKKLTNENGDAALKMCCTTPTSAFKCKDVTCTSFAPWHSGQPPDAGTATAEKSLNGEMTFQNAVSVCCKTPSCRFAPTCPPNTALVSQPTETSTKDSPPIYQRDCCKR